MERGRLSGVLVINQKKEDNTETNNYHKDDMYKDSGLVGMDMTKQLSDSPYTEISTARMVKPKTTPPFFKAIADFFQQDLMNHIYVKFRLIEFLALEFQVQHLF